MQSIKYIVFCFICFLPLKIYAALDDSFFDVYREGSSKECYEEKFSQVDVRACIIQQKRASEKELKRAQIYAINVIIEMYDDINRMIFSALRDLDTLNRTFVVYRNTQCDFERSLGGYGIGAALEAVRNSCITELNIKYAKMLRSNVYKRKSEYDKNIERKDKQLNAFLRAVQNHGAYDELDFAFNLINYGYTGCDENGLAKIITKDENSKIKYARDFTGYTHKEYVFALDLKELYDLMPDCKKPQ